MIRQELKVNTVCPCLIKLIVSLLVEVSRWPQNISEESLSWGGEDNGLIEDEDGL